MKNKIVVFIYLLIALVVKANAQSYEDLRSVYPVTTSDGKRVINGFIDFSSSDEDIYANSLKWSINNLCEKGRDHIFDVKIEKKIFSFDTTLEEYENGKTKISFVFKGNIKVSNQKLVFSLYDIQYKMGGITGFVSGTDFDKLNPDKKPKHKEIVNSFQTLASQMLNKLFDDIIQNNCKSVTHWKNIDFQRPEEGMNDDECLIAFGKPSNIFEDSKGQIQWSYGMNFILIFSNNILTTIIK